MLQYSLGNFAGAAIQLGQFLRGQSNASIVHAGILFDNNYIIEAVGPGLSASDIRVQNAKCGYRVFRPRNTQLAQGAATCAKMMFDIQGQHHTMKYNLSGAVASLVGSGQARTAGQMDRLLDDVLSGKGHPFFCSQFVVYVFQFVAEQSGMAGSQMFAAKDAKVSPGALAAMLASNSNFYEAGTMTPSHR